MNIDKEKKNKIILPPQSHKTSMIENTNDERQPDDYQKRVLAGRANGISRVSASPGSGKTFLLSCLAKILIKEQNVDSKRILLVTYSRKAASEISSRIKNALESDSNVTSNQMHVFDNITTIHSKCGWFLKQFYSWSETYIDQKQLLQLLKKWVATHLIVGFVKSDHNNNSINNRNSATNDKDTASTDRIVDPDDVNEQANQLMRWISRFFTEDWYPGNTLASIDEWRPTNMSDFWICQLRLLFRWFYNYCIENDSLTFDMVLTKTHYHIVSDVRFAEWVASLYDYVLVDEAQDLDFRQAQIIYGLANKSRNLMMIGDAYQNMYKFRGSDPSWMMQLLDLYWNKKGVTQIYHFDLPNNYRSHPGIVKLVKSITPNDVVMCSTKMNTNEEIAVSMSSHAQFEDFLSSVISWIKSTNLKYSDWMILSRYQSSCQLIRDRLEAAGIPCVQRLNDDDDDTDDDNDDDDATPKKSEENKVIVGTFHYSKGGEDRNVIVNFFSYVPSLDSYASTPAAKPTISQVVGVSQKQVSTCWMVPFLPNQNRNSITKPSFTRQNIQHSHQSQQPHQQSQQPPQQPPQQKSWFENDERTNIRVAISRAKNQLYLGLPQDRSSIKSQEVQRIISEMESSLNIKKDDDL